jgi:hypothetical protein
MSLAPGELVLVDPVNDLIIASGASSGEGEHRILKFAECMGLSATTMSIADDLDRPFPGLADAQRRCVAMSAEMLASLHRASPRRLEHFIQERCATLLVFGWDDPARHGSVLAWLTRGAFRVAPSARGPHGENVFELPRAGREFSRQLAGLSFSTGRSLSLPSFDPAVDGPTAAIMAVNRQPMLIRTAMASCDIFLLAGAAVADIDEPVSAERGIEEYYDQLIPLLVFLRHSFGKTCWHSTQTTARVIIDDPLLTARYGFLNYRALLSSMRRERYGTSIAFIPWNYRRTSSRTATDLFGHRPDLSICIHGCDHTNKEFDAVDQLLLAQKADLAVERMEQHQARTGLPFERVMVFPQGRFSTDALRALRGANYLAAVNSTCFPTDAGAGTLRIADFLRPAITRFHGFPLFHRRYPRRLVDSAFDLFLGKPALLVEHHQYFRDGCERLEEFVIGLRNLEPDLVWPTLSSQLMRSCIMRVASRDSLDVQFFTNRFRLENGQQDDRRFRLAKYEPDSSAIRAVVVDGVSVPFSFNENSMEFELEVGAGQAKDIQIVDAPTPSRGARRMGLIHNLGVLGRRGLSEFRDNTLARHPRLLQAATGLARGLKVTGD